jgi:hypothetical protein
VQQQRQHQQTANAVLTASQPHNEQIILRQQNEQNLRMANQVNGMRRPDPSTLKASEFNANRQSAIQSQQAAMTPQLYSQNRPSHQIGTIPTTMSNTFVQGNGAAVPLIMGPN